MTTFDRVAPIFGVRDVTAALSYYETLGFQTRSYGDGIYGFATRGGQHEGALVDLDGNVIRFGSPMQ